jgi:DNA-binding transcriptional LysR family regulator
VTLALSLDEGAVDLAVGRYDAGIRQEESVEKDSATVRLTPPVRGAVVGSPDYFARMDDRVSRKTWQCTKASSIAS